MKENKNSSTTGQIQHLFVVYSETSAKWLQLRLICIFNITGFRITKRGKMETNITNIISGFKKETY
jgi:hypothetical protein